jgi:hypothetical protein
VDIKRESRLQEVVQRWLALSDSGTGPDGARVRLCLGRGQVSVLSNAGVKADRGRAEGIM